MVHAVIVDDEINGVKSLELLLKGFATDIKLVGTSTDAVKAVDMINLLRPDIVFLDISMPDLNGFDVLERLEHKKFYLVFTTAHKKYALQALKLGATDYLLKPVDFRELHKTIEKIKLQITVENQKPNVYETLQKIFEVRNIKIHLPTKTGIEYVSPDDIIYIEADSKYARVNLVGDVTVNVTNGLKDYDIQLCKNELNFLRIHHSYIVNLNYVMRYMKDGSSVIVSGKRMIPISRQKKEELMRIIRQD
jgi:two-component system LytT family response regulator